MHAIRLHVVAIAIVSSIVSYMHATKITVHMYSYGIGCILIIICIQVYS